MDVQLRNLIAKQNIIDEETCDSIVEKSKDWNWMKHQWYSHQDQVSHTHDEKELDVVYSKDIPSYVHNTYMMHINQVWKEYMHILPELLQHGFNANAEESTEMNPFNMVKYWTSCRMNRYSEGTCMRPHYDHIHSIFEGEKRGIPILSVIGCLSDPSDYDGGQLIFWDDFEVKMEKGDIILFPSNYLYPHQVKEVTRGERHTFVSWGF